MICAKTAEPIEMPFGTWTRVDPRNRVLGGGLDPPGKKSIVGASPEPLWSIENTRREPKGYSPGGNSDISTAATRLIVQQTVNHIMLL